MHPIDLEPFHDEELDIAIEKDIDLGDDSFIIVYNDDVNTFDWVIECFMDICGHTFEQSEQLAVLIHYKGKAMVKKGQFDQLKPIKDALVDRGLSAVIQTDKAQS